jgi:hypothetical protein
MGQYPLREMRGISRYYASCRINDGINMINNTSHKEEIEGENRILTSFESYLNFAIP